MNLSIYANLLIGTNVMIIWRTDTYIVSLTLCAHVTAETILCQGT